MFTRNSSWQMMMSGRFGNRSASAPPTAPNSMVGTTAAIMSSGGQIGSRVVEKTDHWRAVV